MHRAYVANQNRTRINLCMPAELRSPPRDVKAFGFFDNRVSNLIVPCWTTTIHSSLNNFLSLHFHKPLQPIIITNDDSFIVSARYLYFKHSVNEEKQSRCLLISSRRRSLSGVKDLNLSYVITSSPRSFFELCSLPMITQPTKVNER